MDSDTLCKVAVRAFPSRDAIALCYRRQNAKGRGSNVKAHIMTMISDMLVLSV